MPSQTFNTMLFKLEQTPSNVSQRTFGTQHYTSFTPLRLPTLPDVFRTFVFSSPPLRLLGLRVFGTRTGDAGAGVSSSKILTVSVVVVMV